MIKPGMDDFASRLLDSVDSISLPEKGCLSAPFHNFSDVSGGNKSRPYSKGPAILRRGGLYARPETSLRRFATIFMKSYTK